MLAAQLLLSVLVALTTTAVSVTVGNGVLFSLAVYVFSGMLTLILLSTWDWVRADI